MDNSEFQERIKDLSGTALKEAIKEEKIRQAVNLICRQTDYTQEKALERLTFYNNNMVAVIKEYINPNKVKPIEEKKKSTNQLIMGEIRGFMDNVSNQYEKRKNYNERVKRYYENMMKNKKVDEE